MPTFLDEEQVAAYNAERRVARFVSDDAAVYVYRGKLSVRCRADGECDGQCDDECHWLVDQGEAYVVESYDRASTSIFFQLSEEEYRNLIRTFEEAL